MQILVTGGLGYIGSHTSVELLQKGFDVVIVDDLSNSKLNVFDKIKDVTGKNPKLEIIDLKDKIKVEKLFRDFNFDGIIHFAAHKSVNESVNFPEKYFKNNIVALENLLENIDEEMYFIFSSSCTVYGQADRMPITETLPIKKSESPYGETKQICEGILKKFCEANPLFNNITLRYFNPGDVSTASKKANIVCRDFEYMDGDRVSILVNDEVVVENLTLTYEFRGINLKLKEGFNKIDFVALNLSLIHISEPTRPY